MKLDVLSERAANMNINLWSYVVSVGVVILVLMPSTIADPVEVSWDFTMGLEGWANATREEMNLDVSFQGGELRGQVRGREPHMDSPPLTLNIDDREYLVARMMYTKSEVTKGKVALRGGAGPAPAAGRDHGRAAYARRGRAAALGASGGDPAAAVDGDAYTVWSAPINGTPWIIFDLGGYYHLTELSIQVDESAPARTVRLEKAITHSGEYVGVYNFTVQQNISSPQIFKGFSEWGQYWRVHFIDNYNHSTVGVREIEFAGPDPLSQEIEFDLEADGEYHTYYIPIHESFFGKLTRLRFYPAIENSKGIAPNFGHLFRIEWIRIIKAPTVKMVTGCIDKYFESENLFDPVANIQLLETPINEFLINRRTLYLEPPPDLPFATTYNCLQGGGERVRLRGSFLGGAGAGAGSAPPLVEVGGARCGGGGGAGAGGGADCDPAAPADAQDCTCVLPAAAAGGGGGAATVRVLNPEYPGLYWEGPYLDYQVGPEQVAAPGVSNLGARSADVSWAPPQDPWAAMATTGYRVSWYELEEDEEWEDNGEDSGEGWQHIVVGNVTTTTIIDLPPDTPMIFRISPIAENQSDLEWTKLDLYGRRSMLDNAEIGEYSIATNVTATLKYDFKFAGFNANSTLNHSAADPRATLGPSGVVGGEGHRGLVLVGDAHIENCNTSSTCCDGYNASLGLASCSLNGGYMCSGTYRGIQEGGGEDEIPSSLGGGSGIFPESKVVISYAAGASLLPPVEARCGGALRLTPSSAGRVGAAWYGRKVNVREGFETSFSFELSNPSVRCHTMDDAYTHCRARGADGFAFVIQEQSEEAMGEPGQGLGYSGIQNSIAIEFDTYFNPGNLEPYENHISVHTRGFRFQNSANQSYSLGATTGVYDLTDKVHQAKIIYRPSFNASLIFSKGFESTGHVSHFLENAQFKYGAMADWGTGMGTLQVFLDDLSTPALVVPLNLAGTLALTHGRARVGFTAATGEDTWQAHDILDWEFTQLREDPPYHSPPVVNGLGAHACAAAAAGEEDGAAACVHW